MRPSARHPPQPARLVRAVNTKSRPIEIRRAGVVCANGARVYQPLDRDEKLPARLGEGESVEIELDDSWLEGTSLLTQSEIVGLVVEDSQGSVYESDAMR